MVTTSLKEELVTELTVWVTELGGDVGSLPRTLAWLVENRATLTPSGVDSEKLQLREQIKKQAETISQLQKELQKKEEMIDGLRNQDPKLISAQMKLDWEKEKWQDERELKELKQRLDEKKVTQRGNIEAMKILARADKLDEISDVLQKHILTKLELDMLGDGE